MGPLFAKIHGINSWKSVWYVSGDVTRRREVVKGYSVPFATHRRIPADMIPAVAGPETRPVCLDTRWWEGTRIQPADDARRSMRVRPVDNPRAGYAALIDSSLYLAFRDD
jgi:hypothetical protein